ncbi:hypothetical protein E8E12_003726 [Didymella heteroderae]|uniref:Uncharacterized protein n=1 Tax=Didymella heteroderae TaxID=1769908 RepID=A0A9P4WIC9_9PLEO|nr:hypothetical protein E8E12_003726 [Didymella heteroderae]
MSAMAAVSELSSKDASKDEISHLEPKNEIIDTTGKDEMNLNLKEMGNSVDKIPSQPTSTNPPLRPNETKPEPSKHKKTSQWLLWFLKDQWFLLAMASIILISSQVQVPASQQKIKRTAITYLSVSVIFFINGCTLPTRLLIENYMRWKLHFFVQLQCYLVCSAATFGIVSLCATNRSFMDPWLLIGFLFVGSAPTTMSSNVVMTRQAHGNTALTVVQSVIGQFLCPFLSPIIVQMYLSSGAWYSQVLEKGSGYGEIYRRVFMQLGLSLFLPMAVGQVVQYYAPKALAMVVPLTSVMYINISTVEQSKMQIPAIIFQAFQVGIGGLMTIAFRRWIRSEEEKEEAEKAEKVECAQIERSK